MTDPVQPEQAVVGLAGCILRDHRGRILLLHRATATRTHWEIPGGKIEPGEKPPAAAAREAREELGVTVVIERHLGSMAFREDEHEFLYTWFQGRIVRGVPRVREPVRHDECRYFEVAELRRMIADLSPNTRNFLAQLDQGSIHLT